MKAFLDAGFLLTLIMEMSGSRLAWQLTRNVNGPLHVAHLECFHIENRLLREARSGDTTESARATATGALQSLQRNLDELVFQTVAVDYDLAIQLAVQWQRHHLDELPSALLMLWPAIAVTVSATHFLSFDPRTRKLAKASGLKILPETL